MASDRCASNPLSLIPELRIRSKRTNKLDRKSDELSSRKQKYSQHIADQTEGLTERTDMHPRQYRVPAESTGVRSQ